MKQKKSIFITGGAGFVGSALVPYLLERNFKVTVFDLMIYGNCFNENNNDLTIVKGDIRDIELVEKTSRNHDIAIHLACISNDPSFELNSSLGKSINFDCFFPMIKAFKKNKLKKIIYASSSSVYGIKDKENVIESDILEPLTDYSFFKAECEKILLNETNESFIGTILRPATVCGYAPRLRLDVVVNIFTNLAYNKRRISVFGGDQLRPNININDMVRAYELLINTEDNKIENKIYNVGDENKSVLELAKIVKNVIGNDVELEKIESSDNRSYHISSNKIFEELNFKTKYSIKNAVENLKISFESGLIKNSLENKKFFNIKMMQHLNLK